MSRGLLSIEGSAPKKMRNSILSFMIRNSNCNKYSRTSRAQTLMARLPCLTRTCSWVLMSPCMRLLWSNISIYAFRLLFSLCVFSDRRSLKFDRKSAESGVTPAWIKSHKLLFELKKIFFAVFERLMG